MRSLITHFILTFLIALTQCVPSSFAVNTPSQETAAAPQPVVQVTPPANSHASKQPSSKDPVVPSGSLLPDASPLKKPSPPGPQPKTTTKKFNLTIGDATYAVEETVETGPGGTQRIRRTGKLDVEGNGVHRTGSLSYSEERNKKGAVVSAMGYRMLREVQTINNHEVTIEKVFLTGPNGEEQVREYYRRRPGSPNLQEYYDEEWTILFKNGAAYSKTGYSHHSKRTVVLDPVAGTTIHDSLSSAHWHGGGMKISEAHYGESLTFYRPEAPYAVKSERVTHVDIFFGADLISRESHSTQKDYFPDGTIDLDELWHRKDEIRDAADVQNGPTDPDQLNSYFAGGYTDPFWGPAATFFPSWEHVFEYHRKIDNVQKDGHTYPSFFFVEYEQEDPPVDLALSISYDGHKVVEVWIYDNGAQQTLTGDGLFLPMINQLNKIHSYYPGVDPLPGFYFPMDTNFPIGIKP